MSDTVKDRLLTEAKRFQKRARNAFLAYPIVIIISGLLGYIIGEIW